MKQTSDRKVSGVCHFLIGVQKLSITSVANISEPPIPNPPINWRAIISRAYNISSAKKNDEKNLSYPDDSGMFICLMRWSKNKHASKE